MSPCLLPRTWKHRQNQNSSHRESLFILIFHQSCCLHIYFSDMIDWLCKLWSRLLKDHFQFHWFIHCFNTIIWIPTGNLDVHILLIWLTGRVLDLGKKGLFTLTIEFLGKWHLTNFLVHQLLHHRYLGCDCGLRNIRILICILHDFQCDFISKKKIPLPIFLVHSPFFHHYYLDPNWGYWKS